MFTALQFSQLIAAAWSGPAAAHFATISHYVAPGGYATTAYCASYAALAGVPVCRRHAQQAIARHAATFAGLQLHRPGFACRARRHRCVRLHHA